jgi:Mor family transcriptional regulator
MTKCPKCGTPVVWPGPSANHDRNAEIYNMRQSGVKLKVLSERYGISMSRINKIIRREAARREHSLVPA